MADDQAVLALVTFMEEWAMRRRNAFRPESLTELEGRVVLSRMGATAHVAALVPGARLPGRKVAPVPAGINAAFDSFLQDYTQARGVYLSVLTSNSNDAKPPEDAASNSALRAAFTNYTLNRVNLLGQQLNNLFVKATASGHQKQSNQVQSQGSSLVRLVQTRVNGLSTSTASTTTNGTTTTTTTISPNVFRIGTLGRSLLDATPAANASPGTIALDTLAQDQAIDASRLAVANGFAFNKIVNSGKNSKK